MPKTGTPRPAPAPASAPGRVVVHVMGTVVSFDLRDQVPADALAEAIGFLHHADTTFSLYKPNSDIARLGRGEVRLADCHPDVAEVLGLCEDATKRTERYFTAYPHGALDPTGLVKGWAIQRASELLADAGSLRHSVNGGGDIQFFGDPTLSPPWRVGIADPAEPGTLLGVAACRDGAFATSGTVERGHHIVNPLTGQLACHFASVSIAAPSLIDADVLATAAVARGHSAVDWIEQLAGVEGLFVTADGAIHHTSGFPLL